MDNNAKKKKVILMNILSDVYICPLRKKNTPLLPDGTVNCTHPGSIANLQRTSIEIKKAGAIAGALFFVNNPNITANS